MVLAWTLHRGRHAAHASDEVIESLIGPIHQDANSFYT